MKIISLRGDQRTAGHTKNSLIGQQRFRVRAEICKEEDASAKSSVQMVRLVVQMSLSCFSESTGTVLQILLPVVFG